MMLRTFISIDPIFFPEHSSVKLIIQSESKNASSMFMLGTTLSLVGRDKCTSEYYDLVIFRYLRSDLYRNSTSVSYILLPSIN